MLTNNLWFGTGTAFNTHPARILLQPIANDPPNGRLSNTVLEL